MSRGRKRPTYKVFVYGTLRQSKTVTTHTLPDYQMYAANGISFNFPFIRPHTGSHVKGELLEVTAAELSELDNYEGVSRGLYTRESKVVVPHDGGDAVEAFVYVGGEHFLPPAIASGDWFHR